MISIKSEINYNKHLYLKEKEKNEKNEILINELKQLYLKEKEKNRIMSLELKQSKEVTSKWKSKYNKLYSQIQKVLLNDKKKSSPSLYK